MENLIKIFENDYNLIKNDCMYVLTKKNACIRFIFNYKEICIEIKVGDKIKKVAISSDNINVRNTIMNKEFIFKKRTGSYVFISEYIHIEVLLAVINTDFNSMFIKIENDYFEFSL